MYSKFGEVFGSKIMDLIPRTIGANGHFTIPKKLLLEMAAKDKTGSAQKLLEGVQNPNLEVAYKAQSNYSIAAINLRDGQKSVAKGAVSVVNPGEEALVKTRISIGENGKVVQANGFVDASKYPDVNDVSASISRKNGVQTIRTRVGDAMGYNASVDTEKAQELLRKIPKGEELVEGYRETVSKAATKANEAMEKVRKVFAGQNPEVSAFSKAAELKKVEVSPDAFKKFKDAGFELMHHDKINKFQG